MYAGLEGPWGSSTLKHLKFLDSRDMKVEKLSALPTSRRCPPGDIPGTHFC